MAVHAEESWEQRLEHLRELAKTVPPITRNPERMSGAPVMSESGFKLSADFFHTLWSRLEEERAKRDPSPRLFGRHSSRYSLPYPLDTLPSLDHLVSLVNTVFWASLKREEGRHLSFSVGYEKASSSSSQTFAFTPEGFTSEKLAKMAPAIGSPQSSALVTPDDNGNLVIWGLSRFWGTPFSIKVLDPGQLIVSFGMKNVAAISGSKAVVPIRYGSISSSIWSPFERHNEEDHSAWSDLLFNQVLEVVRAVRRLGHGGALIIVPDGEGWRELVDKPIPYQPSGRYSPVKETLTALQELTKDDSPRSDDRSYYWRMLDEAITSIAQLTAVDGAVVITPDLDVLGFGVKLKAVVEPPECTEIVCIDPLDQTDSLTPVRLGEEFRGTRHQSAARFVFCHKQAVAIVVSQDRNVTAFVWERNERFPKGRLVAHRRLELTLF